jgi:hypothetical protein
VRGAQLHVLAVLASVWQQQEQDESSSAAAGSSGKTHHAARGESAIGGDDIDGDEASERATRAAAARVPSDRYL